MLSARRDFKRKEDDMIGRTRRVRMGATLTVGVMLAAGAMASVAWAEDGKATFDKNCASCHGAAGKGDGPVAKALKPPPGDFATSLKGVSDADIAKLIKEGGKPLGKNHAAFGSKVNDAQIAALVQYVTGLSGK